MRIFEFWAQNLLAMKQNEAAKEFVSYFMRYGGAEINEIRGIVGDAKKMKEERWRKTQETSQSIQIHTVYKIKYSYANVLS